MGNSITNWLTDRRQRVVVDGEVSSWKSVLSGVPQGYYARAYFIVGIYRSFRGRVTGNILKFQMTLNCSEKLRKLEINKNYEMTLIN